jgi:hypothetical protein
MSRLRWIVAALVVAGIAVLLLFAVNWIQKFAGSDGPLATRLLLSGLDDAISRQQIVETTVDIDLSGELLRGHAALRVKAGPGVDTLCLLLNPGLRVTSAVVCGEPVQFEHAQFVLRLFIPPGCADQPESLVQLRYEGRIESTVFCDVARDEGEILLPALALWYPLDLHSFSTHRISVTVPEGFVVAGGTPVPESEARTPFPAYTWSCGRPVWGATLAAGKYRSLSRQYGGIQFSLYWPEDHAPDGEVLLQTLANVYSYQAGAYGDSGFDAVTLVLAKSDLAAQHGGNAVGVLPIDDASAPREQRLLHVAEMTARMWWGGTVGVRWFSSRPEAARWVSESLPVYSAWQALEHFEGRRAFLRMVEALDAPGTIHTPMNRWPMADTEEETESAMAHLRVRGPLIAQMITEITGKESFNTGCRNFFAVHRHGTASYAALRHEIELAAELDLEEFFRVWLDRGGTFDYAVQSVERVGDQLTVAIRNEGDIPALHPIEIAIISGQTAHIREIRTGAYTNTFTFAVASPVTSVALDPYFATADLKRSNNVWPRRGWPQDVAASAKGGLAVSFRREWHQAAADATVWTGAEGQPVPLALPGELLLTPLWAPSGNALAIPSAVPAIWNSAEGVRLCRDGGSVLGWQEDELWLYRQGVAGPGGTALAFQPTVQLASRPQGNSFRFSATTGASAWIDAETGCLQVLTQGESGLEVRATPWQPAGDFAWAGDSPELVFLTRNGEVLRGDPLGGEIRSMLDLKYPVEAAAVSRQGRLLAWLDEGGSLRVLQEDRMIPRLIPVPGEIRSFSWEGDAALVCLVSVSSRLLPMRFHSDWALFRVSATTWEATKMDIDLQLDAFSTPSPAEARSLDVGS